MCVGWRDTPTYLCACAQGVGEVKFTEGKVEFTGLIVFL